jgi:hypothetical protein
MNVIVDVAPVLAALKHFRTNCSTGEDTRRAKHQLITLIARSDIFCLETPALAFGMQAMVLKLGGFTIRRTYLEKILTKFSRHESLMITASSKHIAFGGDRTEGDFRFEYWRYPKIPDCMVAANYSDKKSRPSLFKDQFGLNNDQLELL